MQVIWFLKQAGNTPIPRSSVRVWTGFLPILRLSSAYFVCSMPFAVIVALLYFSPAPSVLTHALRLRVPTGAVRVGTRQRTRHGGPPSGPTARLSQHSLGTVTDLSLWHPTHRLFEQKSQLTAPCAFRPPCRRGPCIAPELGFARAMGARKKVRWCRARTSQQATGGAKDSWSSERGGRPGQFPAPVVAVLLPFPPDLALWRWCYGIPTIWSPAALDRTKTILACSTLRPPPPASGPGSSRPIHSKNS